MIGAEGGTAESTVSAPFGEGEARALEGELRPASWPSRLAPVIVGLLAVMPSWWFTLSKPWLHFSVNADNALLELAVRDALRGEQLLGPGSRFGWNHPGPLQFYLLAPLYLVTGQQNASVWVGSLVLHTLVVITAVVVAGRLGGVKQAWLTTATMSLLTAHMGPGFLGHAWGPHSVILPLALFELLVVGLALKGEWWLPAVAFVGTYLVQTHVGLAPICLPAGRAP